MNKYRMSKSLEDVFEWKEECWREVAHLPLREAIRKRLRDSARVAAGMGFVPDKERQAHAPVAAEPAAEYRASRQTKRRKNASQEEP